MFGSGTGTKGAGGPGILQMLGNVAIAMPLLPFVTGVLGALIATVGMASVDLDGAALDRSVRIQHHLSAAARLSQSIGVEHELRAIARLSQRVGIEHDFGAIVGLSEDVCIENDECLATGG